MRMPLAPCRMGSMMHAAKVLLFLFSSSCLRACLLHEYVHAICALKNGLYDDAACVLLSLFSSSCLHTKCVI